MKKPGLRRKPFRTVLLRAINEKPLETVQGMIAARDHRAEAAVLMKSLRAPEQ